MPLKLYRRGKVWHYRGTVAGRRISGSAGTADKAIAQRIAAEAEARQFRRHLDGPGADVTFAQAALAYRQAEKQTRFLPKIEDYWKDTRIREITTGAIQQSARMLYPNGKGATRNRQVIVPTQAIINFAAELGWCSKIGVKRFPVETKTKEAATLAWAQDFAAEASPHLGALCLFMFATGARIGEAVALTWQDIDLSDRKAVIRQTKIEDTRTAHLQAPVVAALASIGGNRNPGELVFGYAGPGSVKKTWDNVIKRAGIVRLTPHCCRHGFATTMLRLGYDVKTVAKLGGWKDAATVLKTYAHALDDQTVTDAMFGTNLTQPEVAKAASGRKKRTKSQ